jgi:hypothetical protein
MLETEFVLQGPLPVSTKTENKKPIQQGLRSVIQCSY